MLTKHLNNLSLLLSTAPMHSSNSSNLCIAFLLQSSSSPKDFVGGDLLNDVQEFLPVDNAAAAADVADEAAAIPENTVSDAHSVTLMTSLMIPASSASSIPFVNLAVVGDDLEISRRDEASLTSCFSAFFIDLMVVPSSTESFLRIAI